MPDCPVWSAPETNDQLPHVVAGLNECYRLIISACKTGYVLRHGDLKSYHSKVFHRVVPLDYYAGNYRCVDPAKPCLAVIVGVDNVPGEDFTTVPDSMSFFSSELHDFIVRTDEYLKAAITATERARAVAQLAAVGMGHLIRIHPFVNGNGRIARMLVNYTFKRYGYKMPFSQAQIHPRETEYDQASAAAMGSHSDFTPLYVYILKLVARVVP